MTPEKNDATVLVRLPSDLKHALQREAYVNGRRITAEINMRLASSLRADSYAPTSPASHGVREPAPGEVLTPEEAKLLRSFRNLPPDKQAALLSLLA